MVVTGVARAEGVAGTGVGRGRSRGTRAAARRRKARLVLELEGADAMACVQMTAEGQGWLGLVLELDGAAAMACVQMTVEGQAWLGVAKSHEVIAAGLRAPAAANPPAPSPWDACVLLLHCRHLSLCGACEPAVNTCPVCASTKNASLHVLLS